ncbi:hypothetical protein WJX73_003420 [Symbiochloris irregularis]|uniref:Uncharacterized protein n=1 Tax=Symbiochloris irregularis TaxID=706552 RepID=A0AAW1NLH0_9CHLO
MGQGGSRQAGRAVEKLRYAKPNSSPTSTTVPEMSSVPVNATVSPVQNEVVEPPSDQFAEQKDVSAVRLMDRLTGAITNRPVEIHDRQRTRQRKSYAEREADLRGRLSPAVLRDILKIQQQAVAEGNAVDIAALADRYEVDPELLGSTLTYLELPQALVLQQQEPAELK